MFITITETNCIMVSNFIDKKNITNTDKNSTTIPEVHTEKPIIDDLEKVETASDNIDESQIESEVK
jgi:hypothetical protein